MSLVRRTLPLLLVLSFLSLSLPGRMLLSVKADTPNTVYLPLVANGLPWPSPFGFETDTDTITNPFVATQAKELGAKWLRLNTVSWRSVQQNQGDPYNWSALNIFEQELAAANSAGLTPIVIVDDSPGWATILPTACSAVRQDHLGDFANFMAALVARYSAPPYNVKYWELGNEVDIDPSLVPVDSVYGCRGDAHDPYYGGGRYGQMLMVVTPAIRQADPEAKVLLGGLMIYSGNSVPCSSTSIDRPECFLEGILRAGAGPYFDIVAYHGHSSYYGSPVDYSGAGGSWAPYGGPAKGKPAVVRQVMSRYGVSKPLFFDEMSLGCPAEDPSNVRQMQLCSSPGPAFFEAQADHVAKMMVPSLSVGVEMISWYSLEGAGWRNGALLDGQQAPRPAYRAYQQLIKETQGASLPPPRVDVYGTSIEAYRFSKGSRIVDTAWSKGTTPGLVTIPQAKFAGAYSRDGVQLTPTIIDGNAQLPVTSSPIYIHRLP